MQRCEFCGSEQPISARYCGNCGHMLGDRTRSAPGVAHPQTPPLFSNPSHSITANAGTSQEHMDSTVQSSWSEWGAIQNRPQFPERQPGDRRAALPDVLLPGLLPGQNQVPLAGQVPVVQGTPQVSGVPFVQGTPALAGSLASSAGQGLAHGTASSMSPQAPTWEPQVPRHDPLHHPQPTPPHVPHHHYHSGLLHRHEEHVPRHHSTTAGATTKLAVGTTTKWLIVGLTALIVIASGGLLLVLASSPGLSLSGSNVVSTGSILHLHGQGFLPGGSVTLSLDKGIPVTPTGQAAGGNTHVAGSALLLVAGQEEQQVALNTSISVSVTGTFDADVIVPTSWSAGTHAIHATESLGSRSANLQFRIVPTPAKLIVKPTTLTFGPLQVGGKAVLPVAVSNAGQASLNWSATVDSAATKWLTLQNSSGTIDFHGSDQFINVTADASNLRAGSYHTLIFMYSNGGDAQVPVNLTVVSQSVKKQAHLSVTPPSLDFGQLLANQQVTQGISISNSGGLPLTWQANTGGTSWLTLNTTTGTVQPGGLPQNIQVTASTTALAAGSYSGTVNITSNAGNASVAVTLVVTGVTPTPSPTRPPGTTPTPSPSPSPSPVVLAWSVSPTSLGSSTCGVTAPCTVTLTENASSTGNITWSASSNVGATFTPRGGTLSPGVPQSVSISGMACQKGTFTFKASSPAKPQALTVLWSCTPPKLTATGGGACSQDSSGNFICSATLALAPGSQGDLVWTSSSDLTGVTVSPSGGTLVPKQPVPVTITVPASDCPAHGTVTFSGLGSNSVTLQFTCKGSPKKP